MTRRYDNTDVGQAVLDEVLVSIEILERSRSMLEDFTKELGLTVIRSVLDASAQGVAGPPHPGKEVGEIRHWGSQKGSVKLGGRRVTLKRPRLRNKDGTEVSVPAYELLRSDPKAGARVLKAALRGVSSRNYQEVVLGSCEAAGVSRSSVSRHVVEESAGRLEHLISRPLERRMLAVMIDGIRFGGHLIVGAIGIDELGKKHALGLSPGATENAATVKALLVSLRDRGLGPNTLFVVDGSKALRAAIREVFGNAPVQRCRCHKIRNVTDKMSQRRSPYASAAMRAAYKLPFKEGIARLYELAKELDLTHPGAAASLREGIEESFTVNRLGLPPLLVSALGTTNIIESAHSSLRRAMDRITNHTSGEGALRWAASAFLEAEKNMRTVKGHKHLWMLRAALDERSEGMEETG